MLQPPIYLDHSATTPVWPEVIADMEPFFSQAYGNPSSMHAAGRKAYAGLQEARQTVARHLGAKPQEVVFTSGGTESDNSALRGIALARRQIMGARRIISTPIEHHAILETLEDLTQIHGFAIDLLPVNGAGLVSPQDLSQALEEPAALVSIMLANNEVGTVQPLSELGTICRAHDTPLHTDAVQAMCKVPIRVDDLGVASLSASAHKFHGPKGIGFLYLRQGTPFLPRQTGGSHEGGRRAGTENVPLIKGMAKALNMNQQKASQEIPRQMELRDQLISAVLAGVKGAYLTGDTQNRLPHHASFVISGLEAESMLIGLDMAGIMASSGSACTSGAHQPSHVLSALGIKAPDSYGALRFSLGHSTTASDIAYVSEQLISITGQLRQAMNVS